MRFHWFAEATYPHLPADFADKYRSAWVDPPSHLLDPRLGGESLRAYLRMYEYAAQVGFDGILPKGTKFFFKILFCVVEVQMVVDVPIASRGSRRSLTNYHRVPRQ